MAWKRFAGAPALALALAAVMAACSSDPSLPDDAPSLPENTASLPDAGSSLPGEDLAGFDRDGLDDGLLSPAVRFLFGGGNDGPPSPTTVALTLFGEESMNGGHPAKVKVYYLQTPAAFDRADFFALFDQPEATLGADLLGVTEFVLAPGRRLTETKTFETAPGAVGVVAAFRDIGGPDWRATASLAPNTQNAIDVTFAASAVEIDQ